MFRLSRRNINRLAVLALLAAPIIYLFGGLFTGLVGAHGSIVYADPVEDGYDMNVEIDGDTYERWCFYGENAYLKVNTRNQFALNGSFLNCYPDGIYGYFNNTSYARIDFYTNVPIIVGGDCFGFYDGTEIYWETESSNSYFSVCYADVESSYIVSFEMWWNTSTHSISTRNFQVEWVVDEWTVDGDYDTGDLEEFAALPYDVFFGNDFSTYRGRGVINDQLFDLLESERKAPLVPPKKYAPATTSSPSLNSEYVFGQFFQHDNFLTKMGRDVAASDNPPYGFAPVGMFINYVDVNMLHFYPTDNGMGLFFYGYFYWCAHVLLLDFAFYGVTFIIRLLKKMMERLEGD